MILWQKIPIIKLLIPIIFGIIFYQKIQFVGITVLGGLLIVMFFIYFLIPYKKHSMYILINNLILFTIGFSLSYINDEKKLINFIGNNVLLEKQNIIGEVYQIDVKNEYSKIFINVEYSGENDTLNEGTGKIMCSIKTNPDLKNLEIGDKILFNAKINETTHSKNPLSFDYAVYLSRSNIYYQTFLTSYKVIEKSRRNTLNYYATSARDFFVEIIHQRIINPKVAGVTSALLLGYKNDLDNETKKDYAETGSVHILAVSGMHVMIFYIGIEYLLGLIPIRSKKWDFIKVIITNCIIWFYVFITGMPGSVLRAGLMFSIASFGKLISRKGDIYNSILTSILLLLIYNPNLIYDVGFQLSYMAVFGIIYFSARIEGIFHSTNKIVSRLWKVTALSLAAQITTLPLALYYFHQFPTYFLLAGMIAVPISEVAMYIGMGLFIFEKIPFVNHVNDLLAVILSYSIQIMNKTLEFIARLPFHAIKGFWINSWDIFIIYIAIVLLVVSLKSKKLFYLNVALSLILIVVIQNSFRIYSNHESKSITFYQTKKKTLLIDIIDNLQRTTFKNTALDENQENMAALNFRYFKSSNNEKIYYLDSLTKNFENNAQINIDNKNILFINNNNFTGGRYHWVFINSNDVNDFEKLKKLKPEFFIIGSSVSNYKAMKIKNILQDSSTNFHIVSIDGFKTFQL